jgi:hypothetical protein
MTMNDKLLLALDASSRCIGYSIFNQTDYSIIKTGYLTQPEEFNLLEKTKFFQKFLVNLLNEYTNINEMVIEAAFQAMFGMKSSAKTTTILNKINFGYQFVGFNLGLDVYELTEHNCRKYAYPTIKPPRGKKGDTKIFYLNLAIKEIGLSHFPTKILKTGKRKGETIYESFCTDISDSYIVGKAFINLKKQDKLRTILNAQEGKHEGDKNTTNTGSKKTRRNKGTRGTTSDKLSDM